MNLAGFETAKTTGKGGKEIKVAYSRNFQSPVFFAFDEEFSNFELRPAGTLMFAGMFGIHEKIDLGGRIGLFSEAGLDAKLQILGDQESVFAFGTGVSAGLRHGGYYQLPLYFSFHPNDYLSFYLSPRFINQAITSYNYQYGTNKFHFLGMNTGVFYGWEDAQIGIDYGFYHVTGGKQVFNVHAIGLGIKYILLGDE